MMTIHEKIEGLRQTSTSFPPGTLVQLQFLPTQRSRKWRNASLSVRWSESTADLQNTVAQQESWAYTRWVRKDP